MLQKNLSAALACAVFASTITACSDSPADPDRPKVLDTARIERPFDRLVEIYNDDEPVAIDAAGDVIVGGAAVSADKAVSILADKRADDAQYLSVQIDGDARFGDVVARLVALGERSKVHVSQTTGGKFRREQVALTDPIRKRRFVGSIGSYDLPLIAGYLAEDDKCVLLLGGGGASILAERPLDLSEVDQVSNKMLERYVKHHGGAEAIADKPDVAKKFKARIQAQADTPWRCVAAPMERVVEAGWPVVQYELVP